jgi:hypothetical protein
LAGTVTKPAVLLLKVFGQIRVGNYMHHHLQQENNLLFTLIDDRALSLSGLFRMVKNKTN